MTQEEFKKKLAEHNIPESNYSFDGSLEHDTIIIFENYAKWEVFYYERGNRSMLKICSSEEDVYDFLWAQVRQTI